MKDREKEINYLIYLKGKLIHQTRKEIKELQKEREKIQRKIFENGNNR